MTSIRGFKAIFTIMGVIYIMMASSMLVRGAIVLGEFGIPEKLALDPLVQDFFSFFYLLMAFTGVLTVLFGHVTRERRHQMLVAAVFCVWNLISAWRDLSTSDSRFGNHLYEGEKTIVFVYIGLAYAAVFGSLVVRGLIGARRRS